MACSSCGPKTLTVEQMKQMTSEQIIAAYRAGYKLVQGGAPAPAPQVMSQDWQYGGRIQSMVPTCTGTPKGSGPLDAPIGLAASPNGGVGPYTVRFHIKRNTEAYILMATGVGSPALGTVTGTNTQTVAEGSATTAFSYKLVDSDVVVATGDATADIPTTDATGAVIDPATGGTASLSAGSVRVATTTVDSCVVAAGGPKFCIEYCDVTITCVAPICNFVVS